MGIKIWNMEPQQVNLLVNITSYDTATCTISTFDMSKPYYINDSNKIAIEGIVGLFFVENSTPVTIMFDLWVDEESGNNDYTTIEVTSGTKVGTGGVIYKGYVRCRAKTPTNNLTAGITAT